MAINIRIREGYEDFYNEMFADSDSGEDSEFDMDVGVIEEDVEGNQAIHFQKNFHLD